MSDLAAIQKRDNESGNVWFTGPASFTAQAARDRRDLLVELAACQRWIAQAKHLSNCQFWHGHPSSESEPEARRWIDGPCTCGRDAALKEQP